jgi:hypothetical protein
MLALAAKHNEIGIAAISSGKDLLSGIAGDIQNLAGNAGIGKYLLKVRKCLCMLGYLQGRRSDTGRGHLPCNCKRAGADLRAHMHQQHACIEPDSQGCGRSCYGIRMR